MPPRSPLGEFELLVVLAVARLGLAAYPLAIRDEIDARTGRAASRAAVFITLERLEEKKLLKSRYGEPTPVRGGRSKRFFTLTGDGIKAMRHSIDSVAALTEGLEPLLRKR